MSASGDVFHQARELSAKLENLEVVLPELSPDELRGAVNDLRAMADRLLLECGPFGLHLLGTEPRTAQRAAIVFAPHWPDTIRSMEPQQVPCDDERASFLRVMVANDGDVHVAVQDDRRGSFGGIRVRTQMGGGRHHRTRQALLWLAEAIRQDAGR